VDPRCVRRNGHQELLIGGAFLGSRLVRWRRNEFSRHLISMAAAEVYIQRESHGNERLTLWAVCNKLRGGYGIMITFL
jgi:hypothetical protein